MPLPHRCIVLLLVTLTACSSAPVAKKTAPHSKPMPAVTPQLDPDSGKKPGGYHLDDGPPPAPPDIASLPEPVPVEEPELPRANQPYTVQGEVVTPERGKRAYNAEGIASWYGKRFHGRKTASGERYDMYAFSAAHRTMPIPSYARVTNLRNGRSVVVRVNDRGPFHKRRLIDLSWAAAAKLDFINSGEARVRIERVLPGASGGSPVAEIPQGDKPAAALSSADLEAGSVYLQAGSFKKEGSARALIERLQAAASTDKASPDPLILLQTGSLYRVLSGPYADESSARAAIPGLRQRFGSPVVIYRPAVVAARQD